MKQLFVCLRTVLVFYLYFSQSGFYCNGQSLDDQRVQLQDWIRAEEESSTPDVENIIRWKNDLGNVFYKQGDYLRQAKEVDEALELCRANLNRLSEEVADELLAWTKLRAGSAKVDCGKIDEGIVLIREAISGIEKLEGKESFFVACAQQTLARALAQGFYVEESLALFEKSAPIIINSDLADAAGKFAVHNDLALLQLLHGYLQKANKNLIAASEILDACPEELSDIKELTRCVNDTGFTWLRMLQGDLELAEKHGLHAVEAAPERNIQAQMVVFESLGIVQAVRGEVVDSARNLQKARNAHVAFLRGVLRELSFDEQLKMLYCNPYDLYHTSLSVCQKFPAQSDAIRLGAESVANFKGLANEALSDFFINGSIESIHFSEDDQIENGLLSKQVSGVVLDQIFESLPPDSVFVDFSFFRQFNFQFSSYKDMFQKERYGAWVYRKAEKDTCAFVDLGEANTINSLINALRINIQQSKQALGTSDERILENELLQISRDLSNLVIKPILDESRRSGPVDELIISPDSNLWLIPWAALTAQADEYLIEKYSIRTVLHARSLIEEDAGFSPSVSVVFADPDFGSDESTDRSNESSTSLPKYSRLKGTAKEGALISPQIQILTQTKPQTFFRKKAQEKYLRTSRSPQIAHFATHAFSKALLPIKSSESGRSLGSVSSQDRGRAVFLRNENNQLVNNPWDQCGILLAGCNTENEDESNDGILLGSDILGLDFQGTELVVLSACETAKGDIQLGEGVASLHQAFIIAGADAVLASFWRVGDLTTVNEMDNFYRNCANGLSYQDALAKTQRAAIKSRRKRYGTAHPAAWASFGLTTAN